MLLREFFIDQIDEKQIWARKGKTVVRKYRCTTGQRQNRIVAKPQQCFAPIDIKKRANLKKTRARLAGRMARKARKTKRTNPASLMLKNLNKRK